MYEYFLFTYFTLIHTEILRLPQCDKLDGKFSETHRNQRLVGSVIHTFKNLNLDACTWKCLRFEKCRSVNFFDYTAETVQATGVCELNSERCDSGGKAKLKYQEKSTFIQTPKEQKNVSDISFSRVFLCNLELLNQFFENYIQLFSIRHL